MTGRGSRNCQLPRSPLCAHGRLFPSALSQLAVVNATSTFLAASHDGTLAAQLAIKTNLRTGVAAFPTLPACQSTFVYWLGYRPTGAVMCALEANLVSVLGMQGSEALQIMISPTATRPINISGSLPFIYANLTAVGCGSLASPPPAGCTFAGVPTPSWLVNASGTGPVVLTGLGFVFTATNASAGGGLRVGPGANVTAQASWFANVTLDTGVRASASLPAPPTPDPPRRKPCWWKAPWRRALTPLRRVCCPSPSRRAGRCAHRHRVLARRIRPAPAPGRRHRRRPVPACVCL